MEWELANNNSLLTVCLTGEPELTPKPNFIPESYQLREQATPSVPVGVLVEYEGMDWNPDHTPDTEGEMCLASVNVCEESGYSPKPPTPPWHVDPLVPP